MIPPHPVASRRVVFVTFDGMQSLDLTGPLEVFSFATRLLAERGEAGGYGLAIASLNGGAVTTSSGLRIDVHATLDDVHDVDTLVVVGGARAEHTARDARLVAEVKRLGRRARRVASICTGTFVLAEAGLLDGRRATTHWRWCEGFAGRYPGVRLEPDRIFVRDGPITTSAGVTAGIDLALALLEEDMGHELALAVARLLVVYLRRPGGQAQFSAALVAQGKARSPLAEVIAWIREHASDDLSVADLARRAGMSRRNFARVFTREVGLSPARFVVAIRVDVARRHLECGEGASLKEVAARCGFRSAEVMRRAFVRSLGVSPARYRARFAS